LKGGEITMPDYQAGTPTGRSTKSPQTKGRHGEREKVIVELEIGGNLQALFVELLGSCESKTYKLLKEIKKIIMATQAEVDAITAQLDTIKTQVGKIGTDLADYIADNPNVSLAELTAKATEVATALQAVDDSLPEATP
jgi:ubiquinone biosynthesis protein UbiJ